MKTRDLDLLTDKEHLHITKNNFFSCKQKLLSYCCIIPVLCFPFCVWGFCIFLATLKYPWILNKNVFFIFCIFLIPRYLSKHIVSDWQMELIVKHKCTFIWCPYHFNTPFCAILQYPQSKREILCQKEKQISVKLHDFCFVFYVGWTYILWAHYSSKWNHNEYEEHVICYSAIQFSINFFSVEKKKLQK